MQDEYYLRKISFLKVEIYANLIFSFSYYFIIKLKKYYNESVVSLYYNTCYKNTLNHECIMFHIIHPLLERFDFF